MQVGVVEELCRFPVKSMQGERQGTLELVAGPGAERGFVGDRRHAVVTNDANRTLSAKTVPELLFASARIDGGRTVVMLPSGTELDADDPATSAAVAAWLDRDVRLARADTALVTAYDMTFDPPNDDAEQFSIPTPEGTFFDLMGVHALTTGSLATMGAARPETAWEPARFRPNILIATEGAPTDPADPAAYPEDAWVGGALRFGRDDDHAPSIQVALRSVRCAMPVRAQPGIERDVEVFRTMNAHHDNHLGIYCEPVVGGDVNVGDPVFFAPAAG